MGILNIKTNFKDGDKLPADDLRKNFTIIARKFNDNFQGVQGEVGDIGPQGEKGEKGEKGDTGPQGYNGVSGQLPVFDASLGLSSINDTGDALRPYLDIRDGKYIRNVEDNFIIWSDNYGAFAYIRLNPHRIYELNLELEIPPIYGDGEEDYIVTFWRPFRTSSGEIKPTEFKITVKADGRVHKVSLIEHIYQTYYMDIMPEIKGNISFLENIMVFNNAHLSIKEIGTIE